ncbi:MAG: Ig-like domain-containing protein, partial [Terracidiphilus sp.]
MSRYRTLSTCFLAALLVVFAAGCGQETVSLPGVISVTPAQGATGVAVNATVTATFSMAMSPASISTSSFTVTGPGGTAVAGTVAYSGTTATFTPSAVLAYGTTYTATITTGASSPGGAELIGPYVWSFTTASQVFPALAVVSTVP